MVLYDDEGANSQPSEEEEDMPRVLKAQGQDRSVSSQEDTPESPGSPAKAKKLLRKSRDEEDDDTSPKEKKKDKSKKKDKEKGKSKDRGRKREKERDDDKSRKKRKADRERGDENEGESRPVDDSDEDALPHEADDTDRAFIDDTGEGKAWANPDGSESESEDEQREPAPEAEEGEEEDEISRAIKRANQKGRRRKDNMDQKDKEAVAAKFVKEMRRMAAEDKTSNRNNNPALTKLANLDKVLILLKRKDMHSSLISEKVLDAIREWLEPLPDRSMPNVKVRTAMLEILFQMHCPIENLKSSHVGEMVMMYYMSKEETKENKDLCRRIIEKWSRPLFNKTANHKDVEFKRREVTDIPESRKQDSAPTRRTLDEVMDTTDKELQPGDPGFRQHASIPIRENFDYKYAPAPRYDHNERNERSRQSKSSKKTGR